MLDDLERQRAMRATERWWDSPWWRDLLYLTEPGVDAGQIEPAFDALRETFDARWVRRHCHSGHPILQELFAMRGIVPFTFLCELGTCLRVLHQSGHLGDLRRRLKDPREFPGAHAECIALAQWVQAGVDVRRNVPSGNGNRNCDWQVADGHADIYGEVKRIELSQVNKKRCSLEMPPWKRKPVPYDLGAEGDKIMDVVEEYAGQIPSCGPGVFMVFGRGDAAALPFSEAAGERIVSRFAEEKAACRHIAGILHVRVFLYPEHGLVQHVIYVEHPSGPDLNMDLLKRGFPNLMIWPEQGSCPIG